MTPTINPLKLTEPVRDALKKGDHWQATQAIADALDLLAQAVSDTLKVPAPAPVTQDVKTGAAVPAAEPAPSFIDPEGGPDIVGFKKTGDVK